MKAVPEPGILQKETLRVETFSDGVFCIAVTLLSIEIGVDVYGIHSNQDLFRALGERWPILLAYVISFVNVLLAWIGHHSLFRMMRSCDGPAMIANGFLLMLVALVPFPTRTLGMFLHSQALTTAVVFYTGYFVLISIAFRLLWWTVARNSNSLLPTIDASQIRKTTRSENIGLLCNSIIFCVAWFSPAAALVLSFAMWVYWIVFA